MKLVLVRHGQTIQNAARITQGHRFGTLSDLGRQQAKDVAKELKDEHFDVIYSSDLERCVDTSAAIHRYHVDTPYFLRTEIREFAFGVFEGRPSRSKLVHLGIVTGIILPKRALGVESPKDVRERVVPFINHLLKKHQNDTVLVVTHGGVIRILKTVIEGVPLRKHRETIIPNCSVWRFDIDEPLTL